MPRDDEYEYYESNDSDDDIPAPPDSSPEWVWDDETGSYIWEGETDAETDADFEDFAEDFDDDAGDDDYESEDVTPPGYEEDYDDGDGEAPDWWQEGMPDDWWDYYGDDYEIEEFEIAIDY